MTAVTERRLTRVILWRCSVLKKVFKWYNFARLFSFGAMWMFVVGGRGMGKTYGAKKYVIKRALKGREQFIYARRYKSEIRGRGEFFTDIMEEFPGYEFRVNGLKAEACKRSDITEDGKKKWFVIGFFVALSNAQTYKGVPFPNVKTIIFDEFINEKGQLRYLDDEYNVFMNFYVTVDRWQDKTRVLFLANSVSIDNPYFVSLGIVPKNGEEWVIGDIDPVDGKPFYVANFPDAKDFANQVFDTRMGRFIKDSDYAKYAVGNEFADNHDKLLEGKTSSARYEFTLETHKGKLSIWRDLREGKFYIRGKHPKDTVDYTLVHGNVDEDVTLMVFADRPLSELRTAYRHGRVFFDAAPTRNNFLEVFKR